MTFAEFVASLARETAPASLGPPLLALWHDARNEWEKAHRCVDQASDPQSMWVHAYLHRREGDLSNARYWYARAGRTPSALSLEAEWEEIAAALIEGRDYE